MQTLIVLVDPNGEWSPQDTVVALGGTPLDDGRFALGRGLQHLWIGRDDSVLEHFDADERRVFEAQLPSPAVWVVEWRGETLLDDLLHAMPADALAFVDNDNGFVVPLQAVRGVPVATWVDATAS